MKKYIFEFVDQTNPGEDAISGIHDIVSDSYIQVLFPGGLTEATFSIGAVHDVLIERNETFRISIDPLSLPHGVVLGAISNAIVTIVDNDGKIVVVYVDICAIDYHFFYVLLFM